MTPAPPFPQSLDSVELLASLSPDDRAQIARRCTWRRHAAHEQIIDSASDSRDVLFVTGGKVRIVNFSASGREVSLDDVGPGGFFGELAAIDGASRSATVVALEDTILASLAPSAFLALLREHPEVALAIMRRLAGIIRQANSRIMDLSTVGAQSRVCGELLRLASVDGTGAAAERRIRPIPRHSDVASRASTTRETVARVLGDLVRHDIVRRDADSFCILDADRLMALVDHYHMADG
ncbi:MAG: Crp/Fnr family transcriptional regulator [Alphaproteobacteria bacterium]|nr:Crp/Fnr family transcriptional regulator [Alphaproteobacteria bacterium]